ncbi:MAG: TadE family protein [Actinomycetota bacterium]
MSTSGRRRLSDDRGQAAVEFALALPLIVVVIVALAQVGVTVRNEIAVHHAAREGARAAVVAADPAAAARRAAAGSVGLPIEVAASVSSARVTVTVSYVDPTDVPLIGAALGPVTHRASVTMALEPP